jgi:hypothetical protein
MSTIFSRLFICLFAKSLCFPSELSKIKALSTIGRYMLNKFFIPLIYLLSITSGSMSCPPSDTLILTRSFAN